MKEAARTQLLNTRNTYRRVRRGFQGLLSIALVVSLATLAWALSTPGQDLLRQALPWLSILLLGIAGLSAWLFRHLSRQFQHSLAATDELLDIQRRLEEQHQAWRELRELHQHDSDDAHFLNALLDTSSRLMKVGRISIWLLEDHHHRIVCHASLDHTQLGEVLSTRRLATYIDTLRHAPGLVADDARSDPRLVGMHDYLEHRELVSMLDVGVFVSGELRGILSCTSTDHRHWRTEDISCLLAMSGLLSQFAESLRRREAEHDLYRQIHYDDITDLPTLRGLDASIDRYLEYGCFHLGVLRIGGLNRINETLGQDAGDVTLREVASQLKRQTTRICDTVEIARLPSNRLLLLLPYLPRDLVHERGIDLLAGLNGRVWSTPQGAFHLQFALGMASYPEDSHSVDQLLQRAELGLKKARDDNRYHLAFYDSGLSEWQQRQHRIEGELREAILDDQFCLYFQPQFDRHRRLAGAEMLLRWQHPQRGLLMPEYFIHEAERSGLIRTIGYWTLEQAGRLLAGPLAGHGISLSVNVSVQQLRDDDFVARITSLIKEHRIARGRLVLEVVESLLITPGITDKLEALRGLGVELSLDDFGTGYSSLRYLQDFRVDEIKLDKIFITPLLARGNAPLARSIIALARALNLRLVAEGVESDRQVDFLVSQGIDLMQGYLLAGPEPRERFIARLQATPA